MSMNCQSYARHPTS
uniref:Uncharacterized protein n=1 Tax=Anguilla anguilla TaxID=7936 RepID=A0A0E9UAL6_ANGAN